MQDMSSFNLILRTYLRNGTFLNLARFDRVIHKDSRASFLIFPNYHLNHVLTRDDIRINITAFDEYALVLNATNAQLINLFKYQVINIKLTVRNSIT